MKNGIIAYLPHKRTQNARNKKIIFFAIMKPLKADNAKQNRRRSRIHYAHAFLSVQSRHGCDRGISRGAL
ncbi:hypothetical protein [Helicobacter pylori]|uniref:hypothetical protein n=1 Tax=Helicobacter pylori TaxID=210 RepID=UPI0009AE2A91|nr:hypothetical protein [Helicobacter pylori]